jgi:hypothetical protein
MAPSKEKVPSVRTETIDPKKAAKYLEANTHNRRLRPRTVTFYARQMAEGEWHLNGSALVFSNEGVLLNGQHRLHACIEADTPFKTIVVRGAADETFATIDQVAPRTSGDIVGREGYAQATRKAAAARVIMAIEDQEADGNGNKPALNVKQPHMDVLAAVERLDEYLTEGCSLILKDEGPTICKPPATFVALYVCFALKNRKKAREFFEQITSGEMLEKDDPVYKLRRTLIGAMAQPNVRRKKSWVMAITIKAWNSFLQVKKVQQLKFSEAEKWPRIRSRR